MVQKRRIEKRNSYVHVSVFLTTFLCLLFNTLVFGGFVNAEGNVSSKVNQFLLLLLLLSHFSRVQLCATP